MFLPPPPVVATATPPGALLPPPLSRPPIHSGNRGRGPRQSPPEAGSDAHPAGTKWCWTGTASMGCSATCWWRISLTSTSRSPPGKRGGEEEAPRSNPRHRHLKALRWKGRPRGFQTLQYRPEPLPEPKKTGQMTIPLTNRSFLPRATEWECFATGERMQRMASKTDKAISLPLPPHKRMIEPYNFRMEACH